MENPPAAEWMPPGTFPHHAEEDHTNLDTGMFQHVKELHAQVENYMKALPVNETSIAETVDLIVSIDLPLPAKFSKVDVADIFKKNKNIKGEESLSSLVSALGLLEKYGRNLLKPDRPRLWKFIYFANGVFRMRVDIIKGARDVLQLLGYTETVEDGLSFPADQESPNLDFVAIVTADLAIAKREIELFKQGDHPHAYRVQECLDGVIAMIPVPPDSPSGLPQNIFMRRPAHGTRIVYENLNLMGPPNKGNFAERFSQLTQLQGGTDRDPWSQVPRYEPPGMVSEAAPTQPRSQPSKTATQKEGILHRVGDAVPAAYPAKSDVGLGYFAKTSGKVGEMQEKPPSMAQPSVVVPSQTVSPKPSITSEKTSDCVMCGKATAKFQCNTCSGLRCESCDKQWHLHPSRRPHQRKMIDPPLVIDVPISEDLPPILLCDVCGTRPSSIVCVTCSSSTSGNRYCSNCDEVYHGHPLRQDHSRQPLELSKADHTEKPPPKNIVLSPVSSLNSSTPTETSPAPAKKRPVPAPRRLVKGQASKEPTEPLIPEENDSVFTLDESKQTKVDIKHPPSTQQRTLTRPHSDSEFNPGADAPVPQKSHHSLPSSKRDFRFEMAEIVKMDIDILQQIQTNREILVTCEKGSPMYGNMQTEISRLTSQHEELLRRQRELESLERISTSGATTEREEATKEQPEVRYPPGEATTTSIKYPPTKAATSSSAPLPQPRRELPRPMNQVTNTQPAPAGMSPLSYQGPDSANQQPQVLSTSVTSSSPAVVGNRPEISPSAQPVAGEGSSPISQPGKVQLLIKCASVGEPTSSTQAPINGSQVESWVCLRCGNHNTASSPNAVCMTCRSPLSTTQGPSVAALGQQLGQVLTMATPPYQPQPNPFQTTAASTIPAATADAGAGAGAGAVPVPSRFPPSQTKPISVFTYLQIEEEAMLKEKLKAKEEYERQMATQKVEETKMPSPPPRIKKNSKKETAREPVPLSPASPRMQPAPDQDDTLLMPLVGAAPRSVSPFRSHTMLPDERKRFEEQRAQSLDFIKTLKDAETAGYFPEEVVAASELMRQHSDGTTEELHWLQGNWDNYVSTVVTMATNHLKREIGKSFSSVRSQDASQALRKHYGNVEKAVEECVSEMQKRVISLVELGFSHKRVCELLSTCDGGVEKVLVKLQQEKAQEFLTRIWADENLEYQKKQIVDLGVRQDSESKERRRRILLGEYDLLSWGRAETAAALIDMNKYNIDDAIIAAKECGDLLRAQLFLEKECVVCFAQFPMNKLSTLWHCQCKICFECLEMHFKEVIKNRNILKATCPFCDQPNLRRNDQETTEYFSFLDPLLKEILDAESYQIFQVKLRDWNLMKEDNFRWCAHCRNGFINEAPNRRKMRCPECQKITCFQCKKQWMDQHENLSCAEFQAWKEANDPNRQAEGLAIHLKENGIDCPNCKMRYELAKGGCMHFKCGQCLCEFCCGCNSLFLKGNECERFRSCALRGLHAHHPRDCLFYLRDQEIKSLQKLLQKRNVDYMRHNPQANQQLCSVKEQKEGPNGLMDAECGRAVVQQTGLCAIHYKEYLVSMINQNHIDPAEEFVCEELRIILQRNDIAVPARANREGEEAYRARLLQEVKAKLPLEKKNPRDRAQSL